MPTCIAQHKKTWSIGMMCRLMGVARSGFYHYEKHTVNKLKDRARQQMLEWVRKLAAATYHSYGSGSMKRAFYLLGFPVSLKKSRKLMKEAGVQVKYKVTTDSKHQQPVFENLLKRDFSPA